MKVMFHDDDCGEWLDSFGRCPRCRFYPDMQSTAFTEAPETVVSTLLATGRTLLGLGREPIAPDDRCEHGYKRGACGHGCPLTPNRSEET